MDQPFVQLLLSFVWGGAILFGYISGSNAFPQALSPEEEQKYLEEWKNGSFEARNVLIERNMRLVAHVAKKYSNTRHEMDDLISVGVFGLTKAVITYKHDKNIKLVTYASRCIENATISLRKQKENMMFYLTKKATQKATSMGT